MADSFNVNLSLQYTPPGSAANSGVSNLAVTGTYEAGQAGSIDIPNGTVVGTEFAVPFGSVAVPKLLMIKNNMTSEVGVRLNGAVADDFKVPAGGVLCYAVPTGPTVDPISALSIATTVDPTNTERANFWLFGD